MRLNALFCFISVRLKLCETDTELQRINTQILHSTSLEAFCVVPQLDRLGDVSLYDCIAIYRLPQNHCIVILPRAMHHCVSFKLLKKVQCRVRWDLEMKYRYLVTYSSNFCQFMAILQWNVAQTKLQRITSQILPYTPLGVFYILLQLHRYRNGIYRLSQNRWQAVYRTSYRELPCDHHPSLWVVWRRQSWGLFLETKSMNKQQSCHVPPMIATSRKQTLNTQKWKKKICRGAKIKKTKQEELESCT